MQFENWLTKLNQQRHNQGRQTYKMQIPNNQVSFQNAWLAGFLEGDGGFWVSNSFLYTSKTGEQSFSLRMKFYVTQEFADVLDQISDCLQYQKPKKLYRLTNGHTSKLYYRFETNKLDDHLKLDSYFLQDETISVLLYV